MKKQIYGCSEQSNLLNTRSQNCIIFRKNSLRKTMGAKKYTLKPPAVPALMKRSGFNA